MNNCDTTLFKNIFSLGARNIILPAGVYVTAFLYFCGIIQNGLYNNTKHMNAKVQVGKKIRSLRESKQMEIEVLAERAQLPLEQVKAIEDDGPLPGLAPLIKIARVLGVRLGTFLDDQQSVGAIVSRHEEERESVRFSNHGSEGHENMIYHSLSEGKDNRHLEPFVIDILPADNTQFDLSTHEGEEFIYVLDGFVEINYGKNTYVLEKGDSIYYDSIVKHHVHGYNGQKARILAVVYTPI